MASVANPTDTGTDRITTTTPVKVGVNTLQALPIETAHAKYQSLVGRDMLPERYHQMPFEEFLDSFTTTDALPQVLLDKAQKVIDDAKTGGFSFDSQAESEYYTPLCDIFSAVLDGSDLVAHDTGEWQDMHDRAYRGRTDISIYRGTPEAVRAFTLSEQELKGSTVTEKRKRRAARSAFNHLLIDAEVKSSLHADAFTIADNKTFLRSTAGAISTRAQMAEYAAEVFLRQHRNFFISVYIFRSTARLILWDRSGAIVSESTDYVQDPRPLLTFIYRLTKMSSQELGFDTTVTAAEKEEVEEMSSLLPKLTLEHHRQYLKHALSPGWPIYKMCVESKDGPRYFLVGRYRAGSRSPTGRGTRGYVAYDLLDKKLVFLKDAWHMCSDETSSELSIYELLQKHKVENVPTIICGGDVSPTQRTTNHTYLTVCVEWVRYRLVMKEIGRPLSEHTSPDEPLIAVFFAICGHDSAWKLAAVLHRDVSDRNIVIYDDPDNPDAPTTGLLIDWDLAKPRDRLATASGPVRSGTWRFMSALSQKYPKKPYEVEDDLESFFHVLVVTALRFMKHSLTASRPTLRRHVDDLYDAYRPGENGYDVGDIRKYELVSSGTSLGFTVENPAYQRLLVSLMRLCKKHYDTVNHTSLLEYLVKPKATPPAAAPEQKVQSRTFRFNLDRFQEHGTREAIPPEDTQPAPPASDSDPSTVSQSTEKKPVNQPHQGDRALLDFKYLSEIDEEIKDLSFDHSGFIAILRKAELIFSTDSMTADQFAGLFKRDPAKSQSRTSRKSTENGSRKSTGNSRKGSKRSSSDAGFIDEIAGRSKRHNTDSSQPSSRLERVQEEEE